jgi:hypothetical protein
MATLDNCYNIFDMREAAKRRLPHGIFEFVNRATEDHLAVTENRAIGQMSDDPKWRQVQVRDVVMPAAKFEVTRGDGCSVMLRCVTGMPDLDDVLARAAG